MVYHPFRHLGLKFLSVVIAMLLWLTVAGEPIVERQLPAPLELQNMSARLELMENAPASVSVRVRGLSSVLSQLRQGSVVAVLDVSEAEAGREYYHIGPSQIRAPDGVDVISVAPGTIVLHFEEVGTSQVSIRPEIEGQPAQGYVQGAVTVSPPTVTVTGPLSALRSLKELNTESISINGATRRVVREVALALPDQPIQLTGPQTVKVAIDITRAPVERTIAKVRVQVRNAASSTQPVPAVVSVDVRGPADVVQSLRPDSIVAFVDLAGLGRGRYNLAVQVEPSQRFEVVRTEPAKVNVRIR